MKFGVQLTVCASFMRKIFIIFIFFLLHCKGCTIFDSDISKLFLSFKMQVSSLGFGANKETLLSR